MRSSPRAGATEIDLAPHWLHDAAENASFADWVDYQTMLCDAGLGPKTIVMPEYAGHANYAYHLDAGKFATLLREHGVGTLGIDHVLGDVVRPQMSDHGDIVHLELADGRTVAGDLFIDCTGFAARLIGGVYQVPFRRCGDVLFADRAMALQVPYA